MTLSKAVCSLCRDGLFIWRCAVDVSLCQSWPSFLPRGEFTLFPRSYALSCVDWVSLFIPSKCQTHRRMGLGSAPCCAMSGELRHAGAPELGSTGFSSQNHDAPTPTQHVIPQGQSYAFILPCVPLPSFPLIHCVSICPIVSLDPFPTTTVNSHRKPSWEEDTIRESPSRNNHLK